MHAADVKPSRHRFDVLLGWMSAAPLALILLLTFADVLMRYLFAMPVRGSSEMIQFAMALTIFAALPVVTRQREHIVVGIVSDLVRGRMRTAKLLFCDGLSLFALGLMTWRLGIQAVEYVDSKDATIVLRLEMAPLAFVMCGFALVTCVVVALQMVQTLRTPPSTEGAV
jgi:TRAP-type C4-dicarboxylate transport system permease small subunit